MISQFIVITSCESLQQMSVPYWTGIFLCVISTNINLSAMKFDTQNLCSATQVEHTADDAERNSCITNLHQCMITALHGMYDYCAAWSV